MRKTGARIFLISESFNVYNLATININFICMLFVFGAFLTPPRNNICRPIQEEEMTKYLH
jgi:hypothetical protein